MIWRSKGIKKGSRIWCGDAMIGIFHVQFNLDRVCSANLANFPELHHLGPSREPRSSRSFRKKKRFGVPEFEQENNRNHEKWQLNHLFLAIYWSLGGIVHPYICESIVLYVLFDIQSSFVLTPIYCAATSPFRSCWSPNIGFFEDRLAKTFMKFPIYNKGVLQWRTPKVSKLNKCQWKNQASGDPPLKRKPQDFGYIPHFWSISYG